jgi:hypothetical protein
MKKTRGQKSRDTVPLMSLYCSLGSEEIVKQRPKKYLRNVLRPQYSYNEENHFTLRLS